MAFVSDRKVKREITKINRSIRRVQNSSVLQQWDNYRKDSHRPRYHFVAPEGICYPMDPQGCIYWNKRYHLFYACQVAGDSVWGHASSIDLLHWVSHPVALGVSATDPDRHVYSGGVLVSKEGVPTMIYHGLEAGTCIATPDDDDLISWTKHPENPVIPIPSTGDAAYGRYHVWDTCGWRIGDTYYSISGNKPDTLPKTDGDTAYLFRSDDLVRWEYVHPFYQSNRQWTNSDEDCSCPDFFPLGDKHMLMFISHTQGTQYYLGDFRNETFYPEAHGRMNWPGGACFAQESLLDDVNGRRIFWAWLPEARSRSAQIVSGWSGIMSLPRVIGLDSKSILSIEPAEELKSLRINHRKRENLVLNSSSELTIGEIAGNSLEIVLEFEAQEDLDAGIKVLCSPDGDEQTVISYNSSLEQLEIDTSRSSLSSDIIQPWPYPQASFAMNLIADELQDVRKQQAPFKLNKKEPLRLQIFLDHSVLEIFANNRLCMTQRIYPTREDSLLVKVFSRHDRVVIRKIEAWDIAPTNML